MGKTSRTMRMVLFQSKRRPWLRRPKLTLTSSATLQTRRPSSSWLVSIITTPLQLLPKAAPEATTQLNLRMGKVVGQQGQTPIGQTSGGEVPPIAHPKGRLAASLYVQFSKQIMNVRLCCRDPDVQPARDILIAQPRGDKLDNLNRGRSAGAAAACRMVLWTRPRAAAGSVRRPRRVSRPALLA